MDGNLAMKPLPAGEAPAAAADLIPLGARVGRVVALDEAAAPLVDFPGNPHAPVRARVALAAVDAMRLSRTWQDACVLIVFADQDLRQPIIAGIVADSLPEACWPAAATPARLSLEATEEVVLRCGEAKIVLSRDGKVVVGGREIESRARQKQKIRGGTVSIN